MKFEPKVLDDGVLTILITVPPEEVEEIASGPASVEMMSFGKTDYCVRCKNNKKYTIETYGDIAANIEAAATCLKETGDPSYGLSKGSCS